MAFENFDLQVPGEHNRVAPEPDNDPVTWPGAYVSRPWAGEMPPRIKEMHEYWEPTVGPQWYQIPLHPR